MEYIFIAAVCLLLGFIIGFVAVAFLTSNNDREEQLHQDLFLERRRVDDLLKKIKKLEKENQMPKYPNPPKIPKND